MNRKGQALVEFILILPILLLILFTIVDFGNIINYKNKLENTSTDIARLIRNGEKLEKVKATYPKNNIKIIEDNNEYKKIEIEEKVKIITPFLDKLLENPYNIKTTRIISMKENENNT